MRHPVRTHPTAKGYENAISRIRKIMRQHDAKIAHFGTIYETYENTVVCYEELHVCKGKLWVFKSYIMPDGDEMDCGMVKLTELSGVSLARIHNRLNSDITAEFH